MNVTKIIKQIKRLTLKDKIKLWFGTGFVLFVVEGIIATISPCMISYIEDPSLITLAVLPGFLAHIILGPISFFVWTLDYLGTLIGVC